MISLMPKTKWIIWDQLKTSDVSGFAGCVTIKRLRFWTQANAQKSVAIRPTGAPQAGFRR
jgi:hypothetical protein